MTQKPTSLTEPTIIAEWWENRRGQSIRLALNTYEGRNVFDLRTWFTDDGRLKPGKGFACEVRHLPRLAAELAKAEAKARELGLIEGEEDGHE